MHRFYLCNYIIYNGELYKNHLFQIGNGTFKLLPFLNETPMTYYLEGVVIIGNSEIQNHIKEISTLIIPYSQITEILGVVKKYMFDHHLDAAINDEVSYINIPL